ncbi:alpha/beta fold hydrolase [Actinocrinis puniceicyclus]|uniref:Alpha/beta fold hydrolase n=1 Tax=Actinocrinis puniceicyclus TaxID=977794 RepID=A0A8J7WN22_9ACTN|nr:alpha/beta fold hydrolase [Actinocrinis puniceicyclus]MBS2965401.1 alpha/beta fold hydrolase [Actinocrinis puniceicyclus]
MTALGELPELRDAACGAVERRISVRFAPDGRSAAALAAGRDGRLVAELCSWHGSGARFTLLPGIEPESHRTQVVPAAHGRVVALRMRPGAHRIVLLERDEPDASQGGAGDGDAGDTGDPVAREQQVREREVAVLAVRAARLLPSPDPAVVAVVITADASGSRIWQVTADEAPSLRPVLDARQALGGGVWLDAEGALLSVQCQFDEDSPVVAAVADLRTGVIVRDPWVAAAGEDGRVGAALVWAAHPGTGLRLVARPGARRPLSLAGPGRPERAAAALNAFAEAVQPLGFSPDGRRLALHTRCGVRSRIYAFDLDEESVREVEIPAGSVAAGGAWSADGLRFAFGGPGVAAGLATVGPGGSWRVEGARARPVAAHAQSVAGAAGRIESVVYGGAGWRAAPRLVLALHGGPSDQWSLVRHPLFADLAARGGAVLAPNQRGSTGYGRRHREAIVGAWAVPDLEDVLRIGADVAAERAAAGLSRPVLFGVSYGAFLAMVALAARPDLWRGCVAVAPFLSGPKLYRDATPPVRAMLDRLRACEPARDALGPRDLEALFASARDEGERPPVYLLHGLHDEVIPVAHTRRLAAALGAAGWREGRDLFVRVLADAGHDPFDGSVSAARSAESVLRFVRCGSPEDLRG